MRGLFVADAAVLWCHQDGNRFFDLFVIMYVGIDVTFFSGVTFVAADIGAVVLAPAPLLRDAGIVLLMTFHTFLGFLR